MTMTDTPTDAAALAPGETIKDVMLRRKQLNDEIADCDAIVKATLAPLQAELKEVEAKVHKYLLDNGLQNIKLDGIGMAFFGSWTRASVKDVDALFPWLVANDMMHMLTKAISKEAVKDYMDANNGTLPPGVEWSAGRQVNFRKA
jgi:hypothetical protein